MDYDKLLNYLERKTADSHELHAASAITQLRQRVAELEKELERERMRLAACSAAALGYFEGCCDEYKSASLDDVLRLRESIEKLTAERDFQRNEHQTWKVAHAKKCEQITTLKSALRVAKEAMQHATESWQTEDYYRGDHEDAIDSCREAIAKIYEVLNVPDGSRTA